MNDEHATLGDLGERRIVTELIAPRFPPLAEHIIGIGDDCAVLRSPTAGEALVLTTDPCPEPVVCQLQSYDYYHHGRLTALINVSDLAAMGARPLGLLVSTVMPEAMLVRSYERFLEGLSDATEEWNCPVVGGNIKDGKEFSATGSALGTVREDRLLTRRGAQSGNRICVIGEMGVFWAAVLHSLEPKAILDAEERERLNQALTRPVARIREGIILAELGGCTACMDSSDGIGGTLLELSRSSHASFIVESEKLRPLPVVAKVAKSTGVDVRKLMLAWGDWQLVCTVATEAVASIAQSMAALGTAFYEIGIVEPGDGLLVLEDVSGERRRVSNFASERFSGASIFTHGLTPYIDLLHNIPLTTTHQ